MGEVRSCSRGLYLKITAPTGFYEQPLYGRSGIKRTPLVYTCVALVKSMFVIGGRACLTFSWWSRRRDVVSTSSGSASTLESTQCMGVGTVCGRNAKDCLLF